ncbi:MAG TPA: hypothetical protein VND40_02615 [Nitrososphaerales archaeon]|nr:hypothetical protein [Nitrososphaerales archaeon]
MGKWVVTFAVNVDELMEEHMDDDKIPDLPYAPLCDWLEKQLKAEFPRYATVRAVDDARDGKTVSMRIIMESLHRPEIRSQYFKVMQIRPYEQVNLG